MQGADLLVVSRERFHDFPGLDELFIHGLDGLAIAGIGHALGDAADRDIQRCEIAWQIEIYLLRFDPGLSKGPFEQHRHPGRRIGDQVCQDVE